MSRSWCLTGKVRCLWILGASTLSLAVPAAAEPTAQSVLHAEAAGRLETAPDGFSDAELVTLRPGLTARLLAIPVDGSVIVEGWPTAPGERSTLELTRMDVYAPGARIVKVERGKLVDLPRSRLVFFRGLVAEDPDARVMLAMDPDAQSFEGLVSRPEGLHEIRPWGKSSRGISYLVAGTDSFQPKVDGTTPTWSCGQRNTVLDGLVAAPRPPRQKAGKAISTLHTATIAVDTDNELMQLKFGNNTTSATNYIAALIASMSVMYERDLLVRLLQGFTILRPSTTADPYSQSCIFLVNGVPVCAANGSQLNEFTNYWSGGCGGACSGVSRALAMMLSGKQTSNTSASGIAWLNSLCSTGIGYSFSQVFKFNGSTAAHDSRLVGHELGHNFGSPHTHCYSVDQCYNAEPGCFGGTPSCPAPATYNGVSNVRGTVMSYCHNLGGCNSSEVFHPSTVSLLAPLIQNRVGQCIVPLSVALFSDGFESGSLPGAWAAAVP